MITPLVGERVWMSTLGKLSPWEPPPCHTLVIAPHPDDETVGAGGLIARLRSRGVEVTVIAVTDGENAYPDTPDLGAVRQREQTAALARLGVEPDNIHRLRFTDSGIAESEHRLVEILLSLATAGTHIVAPWSKDFHPDHEACGRAAAITAKVVNAALTSYFFWTWHRGTPDTLRELNLVSLVLDGDEVRAKRDALFCHQSQLKHDGGFPILPEYLLEPAMRAFEVFASHE